MKYSAVSLFLSAFLCISGWGIIRAAEKAFLSPLVQVKSLKQKILSKNEFVFLEQVDFLLKEKVHLTADRVFVNTVARTARADAVKGNDIILQDDQLFLLASRCFINMVSGEIIVLDARVQVAEGFFTAAELTRNQQGEWWGKEIIYTPCDAHLPHWQINANTAAYQANYLSLKHIRFLINQQTVAWAPFLTIPWQQKARSGFLMPRFSLDYRYGIGIRQDYYWYIHEHADFTSGIDWKNGRGIFGTGEIRWAGGPENKAYFKGYGGYAENIYAQRLDSIIQTGRPEFLVEGKHVYQHDANGRVEYVSAVTALEYGSNKKTGYEFFDSLDEVDDTFYNGIIGRALLPSGLIQASADHLQTSRKRFAVVPVEKIFKPGEVASFIMEEPIDRAVQLFDSRSSVQHIPQINWLGKIKTWQGASYKDAVMVDYALMNDQENELIFLSPKIAREELIIPRASAGTWRAAYEGELSLGLPFGSGTGILRGRPCFFARSRIKELIEQPSSLVIEKNLFAYGAYRAFFHAEASFLPPVIEVINSQEEPVAAVRSRMYSRFSPFIAQEGWFLFDRFDRQYPTQEIGGEVQYTLNVGKGHSFNGYVKQGYDTIPQSLWFSPRRSGAGYRITPLRYGADYQWGGVEAGINQDVCLIQHRLLYSFLYAKALLGSQALTMGYLFQDQRLASIKRLIASPPHAFFLRTSLPIGKGFTLEYTGFFTAEQSVIGWGGLRLAPLKHAVRLDYKGHCWGFYLGYEEKIYRQYSFGKHERAFTLSVYADSLGSFAKKIKSNND